MNRLINYLLSTCFVFLMSIEIGAQTSFLKTDNIVFCNKSTTKLVSVIKIQNTQKDVFLKIDLINSSLTNGIALLDNNDNQVDQVESSSPDAAIEVTAICTVSEPIQKIEKVKLDLVKKNGDEIIIIDSRILVFIPESMKETLVCFESTNKKEIEEPEKQDAEESSHVGFTVSSDIPVKRVFTLSLETGASNFKNFKPLPKDVVVASSPGSKSYGIMNYTIFGDSNVTDNTEIVFVIRDEFDVEWSRFTVQVKSYERKNRVKDYRAYVSIGGSYDFLKNDQQLSWYTDVNFRTRDFAILSSDYQKSHTTFRNNGKRKKEYSRWSMGGQYFAGTVSTTRDSSYRTSEFYPIADISADSAIKVVKSGNQIMELSSTFMAVGGRIYYNLLPKISPKSTVLGYYNFEVLERNSISKYINSSDISVDSSKVGIADLPNNYQSNDFLFREYSNERTRTEGYAGLGLRYEYDSEEFLFILDNGIGLGIYDLR